MLGRSCSVPLHLCLLVLTSLIIGCGDSNPTSPSATNSTSNATVAAGPAGSVGSAAVAGSAVSAPDGSTLKSGAPHPLTPADGVEIETLLPTLTIANTEPTFTAGVSVQFMYAFEVWAADGGGLMVVDAEMAPGGSGTTSYTVSVALQLDTPYEWRARAVLNGSVGPWSESAAFRTLAVEILAPLPLDPTNGDTVSSVRPVLQVVNPEIVGDAGEVTIEFQIALDEQFADIDMELSQPMGTHGAVSAVLPDVPTLHLPEQRTSVQLPTDLAFDRHYFWRARGTNGTVVGEFSDVTFFRTPTEEAVVTPGSGTPGGTTGASPDDQLDINSVVFSYSNPSGWAQTSTVTSTQVGAPPICINHTKAGQWPVIRTGKNDTAVEGNPWVFAKIGGTWYAATWEWLRPGQTCKQLDGSDFRGHVNGAAPLSSWTPKSGEQVGLMVSTPARFGPQGPLQERSNVVVITWP